MVYLYLNAHMKKFHRQLVFLLPLEYLPYQYCMADLHRKELLNNLLYLKIPGIYQFNAIPKEAGTPSDWMKKTYEELYV